jgi:hypothetical protein
MTGQGGSSWWTKAAGAAFSFALTLALLEGALRLQSVVPLTYPPDTLKPERRLSFEHHHDMLHVPPVQMAEVGSGCGSAGPSLKILFLGDSWMESTAGIPTGVAEQLIEGGPKSLCVRIINAGTTSFAPSLMLVKGEPLIREHAPDLVVVNIDETDLMDESLRYRATTLRDASGRIERVVPNAVDMAAIYQRSVLVQQPIFTLRLLEQVYYEQVLLPRLRRQVLGFPEQVGSYDRIMSVSLSKDPLASHAGEIAYFRGVVSELVERFAAKLPPNRLLLSHHPHRLHLHQGNEPPRYNRVVADVLAEVAAAARPTPVALYEATGDLQALYGVDPTSLWEPNDPFSHLTQDGYRRYGRFIGKALQPMKRP